MINIDEQEQHIRQLRYSVIKWATNIGQLVEVALQSPSQILSDQHKKLAYANVSMRVNCATTTQTGMD